jgi:rhamnosyltransferase
MGTAFWCKTNSLTALLELKISDFPNEPFPKNKGISHAIERLFPHIAQSAGYYSGICLTDSYAQIRINYLEYIMREKEKEIERRIEKEILLFSHKYPVVYIYGAGICGRKVAKTLNHFKVEYKGFIVSKKQKSIFLRKPILELGEVALNKNTGIILGLDKDNSSEVLQILRKRKIDRNCILRINS